MIFFKRALLIFISSFFLFINNTQLLAKDVRDTLTLQKVTDDVYAIVGQLVNRTPENLGNNATFGVVVTEKGVVMIDAGATWQGAKRIHEMIKTVSKKPVIKVINTGGQDHRWIGNDYFKQLGAEIIASKKAIEDQKSRYGDQLLRLSLLIGQDGLQGIKPLHAETSFDESLKFNVGGVNFEIYHAGQAHTPGDSFVWLPRQKVMFSGDIVYIDRILGVNEYSNSKSWIRVFETMAAFEPEFIVPGHGKVTTLEHAKKDTYNYLNSLRNAVGTLIEDGGDITDINKIDQSKFNYLFNFESLAGRNAQKVYTEMEWE